MKLAVLRLIGIIIIVGFIQPAQGIELAEELMVSKAGRIVEACIAHFEEIVPVPLTEENGRTCCAVSVLKACIRTAPGLPPNWNFDAALDEFLDNKGIRICKADKFY